MPQVVVSVRNCGFPVVEETVALDGRGQPRVVQELPLVREPGTPPIQHVVESGISIK